MEEGEEVVVVEDLAMVTVVVAGVGWLPGNCLALPSHFTCRMLASSLLMSCLMGSRYAPPAPRISSFARSWRTATRETKGHADEQTPAADESDA